MKELSQKSVSFIEALTADRRKAAFVLEKKLNIQKFRIMEDGSIRVYDQGIQVESLVKQLASEDVGILSLGRKTETLEEYFMKLVGEDLQ